jgi:hypothetical protein
MRHVMVRPPPPCPILVQGRAGGMRMRVMVTVVGGSGKYSIVAIAINHRHCQRCHNDAVGSIPPLPPLTTTDITAINDRHCRCYTVNDTTTRSLWLLFVVNSGNGSHHQQKRRLMAAAAMVVFVDGSCRQWRQRWDKEQ